MSNDNSPRKSSGNRNNKNLSQIATDNSPNFKTQGTQNTEILSQIMSPDRSIQKTPKNSSQQSPENRFALKIPPASISKESKDIDIQLHVAQTPNDTVISQSKSSKILDVGADSEEGDRGGVDSSSSLMN